jgi:hypothetical protein
MIFLFYAKAAISAAILFHVISNQFVNIPVSVVVSDCKDGQKIYHTQYYKYTKTGIEFVNDTTGQLVNIRMNDASGSSFYLTEQGKE